MIQFKVRSSRSWFDHRYGKVLAAELADRLVSRLAGEDALFLTLTYRRDDWADPQELYRRSQVERHVRLFIARLGRYLRQSMRGRWLCKLEFQVGGWVHWHLLVTGLRFVDHGVLTRLWGHGHTWVERAEERTIRYVCKYISKEGDLPGYIYLEPIRSLKIVRVSPGFWREERASVSRCDSLGDSVALPVYVPIGEMLERSEKQVTVRSASGAWCTFRMEPWTLFLKLAAVGARCVPVGRGWWECAEVDVGDVRLLERGRFPVGRVGRAGAERSEAPPTRAADGLHLTKAGVPQSLLNRKWLMCYFDWLFGWRFEAINSL
jgi:hypothetical protein